MASKIIINLDTSKENYLVAKCKQNDDLTLEASIFENGEALSLTNKVVTIQGLKANNTYIIQNTNITKSNNKITVNLDRDFTRVSGTTKIEVVLVESGKQNTTFSFYLEVVNSVIKGAVESSNTVTIIEALENKVVEARQAMEETEQLIESGNAATKGDVAEINASLEQSKQEINILKPKIDSLSSGSPKGTFATLTILQGDAIANTTEGKKNIYVVTADGGWYYWNGSAWTKGGIYQSAGISDSSISKDKIIKELRILNMIETATITEGKKISGYDTTTGAIYKADDTSTFITSAIPISDLGDTIDVSVNENTTGQILVFIKDNKAFASLSISSLKSLSGSSNYLKYYITYNATTLTYTFNIKDYLVNTFGTIADSLMFAFHTNDRQTAKIAKEEKKTEVEWIEISYDNLGVELKNKIDKAIVNIPKVNLLNEYILNIGKEFNIYNNQVIVDNGTRTLIPNWSYAGDNGKIIEGGFRITPTVKGNFSLYFRLYDYDNYEFKEVYKKIINIKVRENVGLTVNKKILFIGDSRIDSGNIVDYIKELLGTNCELLGTRQTTNGNKHEGRSGWMASYYCKKDTYNSIINPFYNINNPITQDGLTSYFDFTRYMTNQGYTSVNYVGIYLGANDMFNDESISYVKAIIKSIHAFNSTIKILLFTEYVSPIDDYQLDSQVRRQLQFKYFNKQITAFSTDSNVYIIPSYCVVDQKYDWYKTTVQVSNRNTSTYQAIMDVVHPNTFGYWKIVDALYSYINFLELTT